MIIRVVKLSFENAELSAAIDKLQNIAPVVRAMKGCRSLEIGVRSGDRAMVITYSHWDSIEDLNRYRSSAEFRAFWRDIKPLFSSPAEAWSLDPIFTSNQSFD